jgi:polar amino acid transport system substrate-binding protein
MNRSWMLCALLGAASHAGAQAIVVPMMSQESIAPKWIMRGTVVNGVCPDIIAALEKAEPRLHFTGLADARSIPVIEKSLETGSIGAACALLDTPRRRQVAQIVGKPLYLVRHRLAAAARDKVEIKGYDDLVKLNPIINTSRGAGYSDQLRALGLTVDDSTGDNGVNLKKILAGHGRFVYMNELTLGWYIQAEGVQKKVRVLPVVLKDEPIYFWMSRKADPAAVAMVEHALGTLAASGELARIYKHWANTR